MLGHVTAVRPDTFAALLGIGVERPAAGVAEATITVGPHHLNPHGTAHGALLYTLGGVALAAAANDAERSGLVSAVHIDYLRAAVMGDHLRARAELVERTPTEDLYIVRVVRPADDALVARLSGRASRRARRQTRPSSEENGPAPTAGVASGA
jgi:acyl-CoA thioesterase